MKEVVFLHIGQAGAEIGSSCWDLFCLEHGIDGEGIYAPLVKAVATVRLYSQSQAGGYKFTKSSICRPGTLCV